MRSNTIIGMLAFLWVGMILAVALENVVVVEGSHLLQSISFGVVRNIFSSFNKIELVLMLAMIMPLFSGAPSIVDVTAIVLIAAILIFQVFFVFPLLSQQVDLLSVGIKPLSNAMAVQHRIYGVTEIVKLALLAFLGFRYILSLPS